MFLDEFIPKPLRHIKKVWMSFIIHLSFSNFLVDVIKSANLRDVFLVFYDFWYRTSPHANSCPNVTESSSADLICLLLEIQESEIRRDFWTLRMLMKSSSLRVCYFVAEYSVIDFGHLVTQSVVIPIVCQNFLYHLCEIKRKLVTQSS